VRQDVDGLISYSCEGTCPKTGQACMNTGRKVIKAVQSRFETDTYYPKVEEHYCGCAPYSISF
jgi:hypothetical protein